MGFKISGFIKNKKAYWLFASIVLIVTIFILSHMAKDQLWDWDECLYAEYGRQMKLTGNYLTNQWNGILGFEKPPLYGILLQAPFIFGVNEFTARILSLIFGILLLVAVYNFANRYFSKNVALLSISVLLFSTSVVSHMFRVNTDIGYVLLIFLGVYFWLRSFKKSGNSYLSGLFFALALLIKGPSVASFFIPIFISVFLQNQKIRLVNFFKMLAIFLAVIAPWHIYQIATYGKEFVQIYIFENIIKRGNNPIEFHQGGRTFYFKLFHREFSPWLYASFILPVFYLVNFRLLLSWKKILQEIRNKEFIFLIVLLVVVPFVVITRIQTKLDWYALPIYPFFSIFIAYNIEFIFKKLKKYKYISLLIVLSLALSLYRSAKETRFLNLQPETFTRNDAWIFIKRLSNPKLRYLVPLSERRAKAALDQSPNLQTPYTFIYGGSTCSSFYSHKKMKNFYSIEEFVSEASRNRGVFMLENGDVSQLKNIPNSKILYKNRDYTVFEN